MTWLLESPVLIAVIGVITLIVLGVAWLQTGHRTILYAIATVILLTILGLVVERYVETDTESVNAVLQRIAQDVKQNDIQALLSHLDPAATIVQAQAEAELPKYEFSECNIKSNLTITFDSPRSPTEAIARFNVVVAGSLRDGSINGWRVPRYVVVTFRKNGSTWKVVAYEHFDPREGLLQNQARE